MLVAFGNAIGRAAHFTVEGDRHHGNEFAVLVGKTSKARKGTSWGRIDRLMQQAEEQWAAERVQTGLSSGEGLIWAVRDPIMKRERVKERGSVRYEEVEADPGVADKRLLVYEPEFANVLKQTERQGNTLSAILRVAWDGRDLRSMTKNSPARATGRARQPDRPYHRRRAAPLPDGDGNGQRLRQPTPVDMRRPFQAAAGGRRHRRPAMDAHRDEFVEALAFARSAGEVGATTRRGPSGMRSTASCPRASPDWPARCWPAARPTSCGWRCCTRCWTSRR